MTNEEISRDAAEAWQEEARAGVKASEAALIKAFRELLRKAVMKAVEQRETYVVRSELYSLETIMKREGGYSAAQIISDMHGEMLDLIRGDDPWTVQDLFNIESFHAKRLKDMLEIEAYLARSQK